MQAQKWRTTGWQKITRNFPSLDQLRENPTKGFNHQNKQIWRKGDSPALGP